MLESFFEKIKFKKNSSQKKCTCNGEFEISKIYKELDERSILFLILTPFFVFILNLLPKICFLLIICTTIFIWFLDYKFAFP